MLEITWTLAALLDLQHLYERLEDFTPGSGDKLLSEVNRGLEQLKSHPESAPAYHGKLRRQLVSKRTIGVFYTVEAGRLFVQIVVDLRDSPILLARRVREISRSAFPE